MIRRIVRMHFIEGREEQFLSVFERSCALIRAFPGCRHLELWRDHHDASVFMTFSIWDSPDHLEQYRQSQLFADTWKQTKIHFSEKAKAWTVDQLFNLE